MKYYCENCGSVTKIFEEIAAERQRQNEKWGEQNHPMRPKKHFDDYNLLCNLKAGLENCRIKCESSDVIWFDILIEEVCEAFIESEPENQREEMIQVAAVAVQIIEYLDRKIKGEINCENEGN